MTPTLLRLALIVALPFVAGAAPSAAQGVFIGPPPSVVDPQPLEGKRGRVAHELALRGLGGVDASRLSDRTIALLDNAIHGGGSESYRNGRVRSILSGGGIVQRTIEGIGRR